MNDNQLVSIIIPTYNRAHLIEETLDSVLAQTYTNWECIIVEDGSNDKTVQVIEIFISKDNRFKLLYRNRDPKGAPTCRNIGLELAKGDYIVYLDSDDLLAPFCLEQRVSLFNQNQSCHFLVFKNILFQEESIEKGFYWNIDTDEDDLSRFLRMDALWQTSGPIYKKEFLIKMGGFDENLLFWQDYDLHLRCLLLKGIYLKFFDLPVDVYIRDGRKDTISRSISFTGDIKILEKRINFYYEILNEYHLKLSNEHLNSLFSILYFFSSQYTVRHGKYLTFLKHWIKINRFNRNSFSIYKSLINVLLLKLSSRFSFFLKISDIYLKNNSKRIPDYYVLRKSNLGKIEFNDCII
ncbi:MAG: glycosyltransferase family 2 protein [Flavobacterium sp.]|uniref:glycosyltransferase family 2 protein n=1 Tax=Flavobacterium sp. TaxID=239 RepID=UPI003BE2F782